MKRFVLFLGVFCLAFLLFIFFVPVMALAGDGVNHLFNDVFQPIFASLIGILISLAIGYLIRFINAKTGLAISADTQKKAEDMAVNAVLAVEEKAMVMARDKTSEWTGQQKYGMALDKFLTMVPGCSPQQADTYLHAALARIPGLGATGDKAFAPVAGK